MILVRPSALQADLIAEAVETLQATRRGSGRLPNHDASFKVEAPGAKKPPRAVEAECWVESLRSAKPLDLPGVGGVPLIMLHLFDRELANNP